MFRCCVCVCVCVNAHGGVCVCVCVCVQRTWSGCDYFSDHLFMFLAEGAKIALSFGFLMKYSSHLFRVLISTSWCAVYGVSF